MAYYPKRVHHTELDAHSQTLTLVVHLPLSSGGPIHVPETTRHSSPYGFSHSSSGHSPSGSSSATPSSSGGPIHVPNATRHCSPYSFSHSSSGHSPSSSSSATSNSVNGAGSDSDVEQQAAAPGRAKTASRAETPSRAIISKTALAAGDSDSSTDSGSESGSEDNDEAESRKIPKPQGEVGRPGRGGYNLQTALQWPPEKFQRVKACIKTLVLKKLDCSIPFTQQPLVKIQDVRKTAIAKFSFLNQYRGCWAVDDFVRGCLKYQKTVIKREEYTKLAAQARAYAQANCKAEKCGA